MSDFERTTDAQLVSAYRGGDNAAFAGIYARYADRIYSYCLTTLGDPEQAADASRDAFVRAATSLEQLESPDKLRPWLFAIARNEARAEGRHKSRVTHEEDTSQTLADDSDPAGRPKLDELRRLVWEALDGLGERDRELMALGLIEGLDGEDLAQAMAVDMSHLDVLVSRMKNRVEKALGPLLIAQLGSEQCEELHTVLGAWDGRFESEVRARVARHIGGCEVCQQRRAFLMLPANVLSGIMVVAAPAGLGRQVMDEIIPVAPPPAGPASAAVVEEPRTLGDLAKLGIFAVITLVVGLIGLAVSAQFEPLDLPNAAAGDVVPSGNVAATTTTSIGEPSTTGGSEPGSTTTASPSTPAAIQVSTDTIDFGDDATTGQFDITNTGGQPGEFTVSSSSEVIALSAGGEELAGGATVTYDVALNRDEMEEGDLAETITVAWDGGEVAVAVVGSQIDNPILHNPEASPPQVQVSGDPACSNTSTTVSVRVRDRSPLESVVARWSPDGGRTEETSLSDVGGDMYEAEIGPFTAVQTASVRIVATDELGNAGGASATVTVVACP